MNAAGRWLDGLFRVVMRAYPAAFRARFGDSMLETFRERREEMRHRGRGAYLFFLLRTAWNLVASGLAERLRPTLRPATRPSPTSVTEMVGILLQDLRVTLRSLGRQPAFTLVVVLTLALGVGANSAIFSVVNGVLLKPLPYQDADRLVTVWAGAPGAVHPRGVMSRPDIMDLADGSSLASLVGVAGGTATLTGLGEPEVVTGARVSEGLLASFGLHPELGRDLTREDAREGAPPVVLVSHRFWMEHLGGRPEAVGSTLELQGTLHQIVGVAPAGFDYPDGSLLWRPYPYDPEGCGRGCHTFRTVGRLAEGVSLETARSEADATAARLAAEYPETNYQMAFHVLSLEETLVGDVSQGLWIMLGAVGLVLLIACANVAGLLLVRGQTRVTDVAVRAALGAGRARLAGQVLMECLVLAALGGAAGLGLAKGGVALFRRVSTGTIPRIDQVAVDPAVMGYTAGLVLLVTLVFGMGPALHMARTPPATGLAGAGRGGSEGRGVRRMRGALVSVEVALSLVLLVGAGLLFRSFASIYRVEPGYQIENVVRFGLSLPETSYQSLDAVVSFERELETRLARVRGVEAVGSTFGPPMGSGNMTVEVLLEGAPPPEPGEEREVSLHPVTPGYLETMRIPVLRGRGIELSDDSGSLPVALVNETFVRENFPDTDPMGGRFEATGDFGYGSPTWTIVGIVPDVRSQGPLAEPVSEAYVPLAQFGPGFFTVTLRTAAGAPGVLAEARQAVADLDPNLPLRGVETLREAVARQAAPTRFYLALVGLFAGLAVTLAAVGLYGTVAYAVSRRTREIGLRMALGARRRSITGLVLGQGFRPLGYGVALGLTVAWLGSRILASLLFQVEPNDPLTFGTVTLLLVGVVTLATILPARQAARIDPVEALREG